MASGGSEQSSIKCGDLRLGRAFGEATKPTDKTLVTIRVSRIKATPLGKTETQTRSRGTSRAVTVPGNHGLGRSLHLTGYMLPAYRKRILNAYERYRRSKRNGESSFVYWDSARLNGAYKIAMTWRVL